jgi:hypothetical protein
LENILTKTYEDGIIVGSYLGDGSCKDDDRSLIKEFVVRLGFELLQFEERGLIRSLQRSLFLSSLQNEHD